MAENLTDDIKEIVKYGAKWDLAEHEGYLWMWDSDGVLYEEKIPNAKELHVLVHLLQSEKPIYYHTIEHYVSTSIDYPGAGRSK